MNKVIAGFIAVGVGIVLVFFFVLVEEFGNIELSRTIEVGIPAIVLITVYKVLKTKKIENNEELNDEHKKEKNIEQSIDINELKSDTKTVTFKDVGGDTTTVSYKRFLSLIRHREPDSYIILDFS